MEKIEINIGNQGEGCTFRLDPISEAKIREKFPDLHPPASIYVSYERQQALEQIHGSMWPQIATLLTGLSETQLDEFYEFVFVDPVSGKEIFNSFKQYV